MESIIKGLRSTSDGWRAIIADTFTFDNVRRLSWAIGTYLLQRKKREIPPRAIIAYDTRFMSDMFADTICEVLSSMGIVTSVIAHPIPTPLLSWYVYVRQYDIGLIVTASHNPPIYNGIKIRMPYGGPPDKKVIAAIESLLIDNFQVTPIPRKKKCKDKVDPRSHYIEMLRNMVNLNKIDASAPTIVVDSMHGATAGLLQHVLDGTRAKVIQVRGTMDPLFGGTSPEPKKDTLDLLIKAVKENQGNIGIAHDGDGDRIVAFDPQIGYLSPHDILAILAFDLAQRKREPGSIVASVATTRRARIAAKILGRKYHEVPIGFRHAAQIMRQETVLIAGEENGGIGIGKHMPERDGTLVAMLLVEMIADTPRNNLGRIYFDVERKVGRAKFIRSDIAVPYSPHEAVFAFSRLNFRKFMGLTIKEKSEVDGVKLILEGGAWVLVRAAGTEPLVRIYAEADDLPTCKMLVQSVKQVLLAC